VPHLTITIDERTGAVLAEHPERLGRAAHEELDHLLGPGQDLGCARPTALLQLPPATPAERAGGPCLQTAGYYHDSLVEGPGRRSSVLLGGCDLACHGCWVPHLHPAEAGIPVPVERLADALLDAAYRRDGVSILGGEPFLQPDGLLALVRALRTRGCPHIVCYSGRTYDALRRRALTRPAIGHILDEIEVLIDGPYVEALAERAGAWTGSGNQRVIDLVATRARGVVVPWRDWRDVHGHR
jgi:anaerobic ribonucleoside-triphosphate reductase activating protein